MEPITIAFKGSSNITSAKWDPTSNIVDVTFANGTTYRYANFTQALMKDWGDAKSAGGWFHANVRQHPDTYPQVIDAAAGATPPPGVPVPALRTVEAAPVPIVPVKIEPEIAKRVMREEPITPIATADKSKRDKQWWKDRPWLKKNG